MTVIVDLTDRYANFAVTEGSLVEYKGIEGSTMLESLCLFAKNADGELVVDNDGIAVDYVSAFLNLPTNDSVINFEGEELPSINFIECVCKRIIYFVSVEVKELYYLVQFKCSEMHKEHLKAMFARLNINKVHFIPYCVTTALTYIASSSSSVFESCKQRKIYLIFEADYCFCDCAVFELVYTNDKPVMRFLTSNYSDNSECGTVDELVFTDLIDLGERVSKGRARRELLLFRSDFIKQFYAPNFEYDIKLSGELLEEKEERLRAWYDDDNYYYEDSSIYVGEDLLESYKQKQHKKICDLIETQIADFKAKCDGLEIDIALGSGRALNAYEALEADVNNVLKKYQMNEFLALKPYEKYPLTGVKHISNYKISRVQASDVRLVSRLFNINFVLIKSGTEIDFAYDRHHEIDVPSYLRRYEFVLQNGNEASIYEFDQVYHFINLKFSLHFQMYAYSCKHFLFACFDDYKVAPRELSVSGNALGVNYEPITDKTYLAALIEALFEAGCIFTQHSCISYAKSPHNLLFNLFLLDEILGQPEVFLIDYQQTSYIDSAKVEGIRDKVGHLHKYRDSAVIANIDGIKQIINSDFAEHSALFTLQRGEEIEDVFKTKDGRLCYQNEHLSLEYFSQLPLGSTLFTLSDGFTLILAPNVVDEYLTCLQIPLAAQTHFLHYYLQLYKSAQQLDCVEDINPILCADGPNGTMLIYYSGMQQAHDEWLETDILRTSIALPCFATSIVTLKSATEVGLDTLIEFAFDGTSYDKYAFDVAKIIALAKNYQQEKQLTKQPFIYNLTLPLLQDVLQKYNLLRDRNVIRIAISYAEDSTFDGIIVDTSKAFVVETNDCRYAKLFLLSQVALEKFEPLADLSEVTRIQSNPFAGTLPITHFYDSNHIATVLNENANDNARVYAINEHSRECVYEFSKSEFLNTVKTTNSCEFPQAKFDIESVPFEFENHQFVLPLVPTGQLFYEVGFEHMNTTIKQLNKHTLTQSSMAPCCVKHCKRAMDLIIDKQKSPYYMKCPEPSCDEYFCLKCGDWHEYVDPAKRTCSSLMIECPKCGCKGIVEDHSCYVIECSSCKVYFCYFMDCGRYFYTYKEGENHVISHGKGLGKVPYGDERDLNVNPEHL